MICDNTHLGRMLPEGEVSLGAIVRKALAAHGVTAGRGVVRARVAHECDPLAESAERVAKETRRGAGRKELLSRVPKHVRNGRWQLQLERSVPKAVIANGRPDIQCARMHPRVGTRRDLVVCKEQHSASRVAPSIMRGLGDVPRGVAALCEHLVAAP